MLISPFGAMNVSAENAEKVVTISPYQASNFNGGEFEGWGTSFCWWANRIGYSDSLSSKAATAFYDKEKGLGLNIIRYNITLTTTQATFAAIDEADSIAVYKDNIRTPQGEFAVKTE